MNYFISIVFRLIPLLMALYCFSYGIFILNTSPLESRYVAGVVIFGLGFICLVLFATAATIIRQLIHSFRPIHRYLLPGLGYTSSAISIIGGIYILSAYKDDFFFISGHVLIGVGLVAFCVSTVALVSTKFTLIAKNSHSAPDKKPDKSFTHAESAIILSLPILATIAAWTYTIILLSQSEKLEYFIAGHVMSGLAFICTSLISLVATILRQIQNVFDEFERNKWSYLVLTMGCLASLWGILVASIESDPSRASIGFVVIGLGLICFSISSKVVLLAKVWRRSFELANRIPIIPVITALTCLFMSAFLFEKSMVTPAYYVPAHVLTGLGAICFTLFSIVSILESGTSSK